MFMTEFPKFVPHPLIRSGHAQTLYAHYWGGERPAYRAVRHMVALPDGDRVVLHDDRPAGWRPTDRSALLLHGLAGCHQSPYMVRVASKLSAAGVRTFRMDHRGCGAGQELARLPYHAGRSDDALQALWSIAKLCPDSPVSLVGFSLSGNLSLKLVGEIPEELPANLCSVMAVNPSIDLAACVKGLTGPLTRFYDRYFASLLCRQLVVLRRCRPDGPRAGWMRNPRRIFEFDQHYTAPAGGFPDADAYYARCSAAQFLCDIRVPTLILSSRDDPLIPAGLFENLQTSESVRIHLTDHGGHLGYVGRRGVDPDGRWMDWRVVDWVTGCAQQQAAENPGFRRPAESTP
jgi:uncharacterized protein